MRLASLLPDALRRSVLRKYAVVVLATLLVTGALVTVFVTGIDTAVRAEEQDDLQTSTLETADRLDSYYQDQRDRASLLSENGDYEGPTNDAAIEESLNNQQANFENQELVALHFVEASSGRILVSTNPTRRGARMSTLPWRGGFSFDGPNDVTATAVYDAPRGESEYVAFASPVEGKDAALVVVLSASVRGDSIRETVPGAVTQVVNGSGIIQFSNREGDTATPFRGGTDAVSLRRGLAGESGVTERGDELVAYAPVPGEDLVVVKRAPVSAAYAISDLVTGRILFLAGLIGVALAAFVGLVYRDIVGPVTRLTARMRALSSGDLEMPAQRTARVDEIGELRDGVAETVAYLETVTHQAEALADQAFDADAFDETVPGRLGDALAEMKTNLEAAITELEGTVERLEDSNERLQQFAYVASHDLQEPLRMISSYVDLLAEEYEGELDEEADEYIAFAVDGAERMQDMVDGLLDYSRVRSQAAEFTTVDTDRLFGEVRQDLAVLVDDHDATVTADDLPPVRADRDQLAQVFRNLVENAVEHGGEAPSVHVSGERRDGEVVFSVADDGPGIPPGQQAGIFELFEQRDRDSSGPGMGLAICDRIVARHEGRLWVESAAGEGATFYVALPD